MKELGKRLRALRESVGLSQAKLALEIDSTQSSLNRYENGQSTPSDKGKDHAGGRRTGSKVQIHIFSRCDDPRGKLYESKTMMSNEKPELRDFIEMCFEPGSPMNERLKESLFHMMQEGTE